MPRTATRLLDDLISTPLAMAGVTTGSGVNPLAGILLGGRKPRITIPFDFKLSGVHLVGGLAYRAWRDWKANRRPALDAKPDLINIPQGTTFLPMKASKIESLSRKLVRNPLDVDAVGKSADSLEIAAEIYLASQFALEPGGVAGDDRGGQGGRADHSSRVSSP